MRTAWTIGAVAFAIPGAVLGLVDKLTHLTTNEMGIFLMHPLLYTVSALGAAACWAMADATGRRR